MKTFFRKPFVPLLLILVMAFLVRLHQFNAPVGDWHSWRQADTSAVSRNFVTHGYDILHPRFDDLSNVPSKLDNPQGYRFVEFPIYNLLQAGLFDLIGILTIEEWGRFVSIVSSLFSIGFLYLLVKKYSDHQTGLFTAFFYAFFPFNIYYGRTILPDQTMVAAVLAGTYFFMLWLEKEFKNQNAKFKINLRSKQVLYFSLALLFTGVAFLLKPYAVFFTLPMVYIAWKRYGKLLINRWQLWIFLILSVTPMLLWRQWMLQYPEGIPANAWLLNGNGIRFRPAFFRWMIYERLIKLISGYAGVFLLGIGFLQVFLLKNSGFFLSFIFSSLIYITVFATGNVQHDYYQILIMPSVAILYGLGAAALVRFLNNRGWKYVGWGILVVITCIAFFFSWRIIKDYFNINNRDMVTVGAIVDSLTPKDAKVITIFGGDTSFLYQTKRQGWPHLQEPVAGLVKKGADYLVLLHASPEDTAYYSKGYTVVASGSAYTLIKLH